MITFDDELTAAHAFRDGDVAAFDWLAKRYLGKARSAARQFLRNASDAEDLAHDAFIRAWSYRDHLAVGRRFGPWRRRACVPHEGLKLTHAAPRLDSPDTIANARLLAERIRTAMDGLPMTQRKVAVLYLKFGYRHEEIAKLTSLSEGTVRSHLSIARKRLRVALADYY